MLRLGWVVVVQSSSNLMILVLMKTSPLMKNIYTYSPTLWNIKL